MKIGDKFQISKELCGHLGEVLWISEDGKTAGVVCHKYHSIDPFKKTPYKISVPKKGYRNKKQTVRGKKKDIVYIVDISQTPVSE